METVLGIDWGTQSIKFIFYDHKAKKIFHVLPLNWQCIERIMARQNKVSSNGLKDWKAAFLRPLEKWEMCVSSTSQFWPKMRGSPRCCTSIAMGITQTNWSIYSNRCSNIRTFNRKFFQHVPRPIVIIFQLIETVITNISRLLILHQLCIQNRARALCNQHLCWWPTIIRLKSQKCRHPAWADKAWMMVIKEQITGY